MIGSKERGGRGPNTKQSRSRPYIIFAPSRPEERGLQPMHLEYEGVKGAPKDSRGRTRKRAEGPEYSFAPPYKVSIAGPVLWTQMRPRHLAKQWRNGRVSDTVNDEWRNLALLQLSCMRLENMKQLQQCIFIITGQKAHDIIKEHSVCIHHNATPETWAFSPIQ